LNKEKRLRTSKHQIKYKNFVYLPTAVQLSPEAKQSGLVVGYNLNTSPVKNNIKIIFSNLSEKFF